jgi:AcrR family transcriptional regulator
MPTAMPLVATPLTSQSDIRARAVEATLACIARHGLSKTTIDDVAREAGCARATLYRHIGGKRQLVILTIAAEGERIAGQLRAVAAAADTFEDAATAVVCEASRELAGNATIQFLLGFEPELVLPHVTFEGGDRFLAHARGALAPCFDRFLPPDEALRAAEWVTRVTLAYAYKPDAPVDLADEAAVRRLARQFIVPAFLPTTNSN